MSNKIKEFLFFILYNDLIEQSFA